MNPGTFEYDDDWGTEIHEYGKAYAVGALTEEQEATFASVARVRYLLNSLRTEPGAREEVDVLLAELPGVRKTRVLRASEHWSTWPNALQREYGRLEALSHLTR